MKLNLGCGINVLEGYINYDKYPVSDSVRYLDLEALPLPFKTSSVDMILLSHILEHLSNRYDFMMEIARILKPNGKVVVKLPLMCSSLDHKHIIYGLDYLDGLCYNPKSTHTKPRPFYKFNSKYNWGHPRIFFRKSINLFKSLFYTSMTIELKKGEYGEEFW